MRQAWPRWWRTWGIGAAGLVILVAAVSRWGAAATAPGVAPQVAPEVRGYTGFVFGPKARLDSDGRVRLAGFVFRPTRDSHMADATVTALDVECDYAPTEYEQLFESLDSLVLFTAGAGSDGNLALASCPTDGRSRGSSDLGG